MRFGIEFEKGIDLNLSGNELLNTVILKNLGYKLHCQKCSNLIPFPYKVEMYRRRIGRTCASSSTLSGDCKVARAQGVGVGIPYGM